MSLLFESIVGFIFGTWIICILIEMLFGIDIPAYIKLLFDRITKRNDDE